MKTFSRICIKTETFVDGEKNVTLKRGEEYITSEEKDGTVIVFTTYWFNCPISLFASEMKFT